MTRAATTAAPSAAPAAAVTAAPAAAGPAVGRALSRGLARAVVALVLPSALIAVWWTASARSGSVYFPPLEKIVRVTDDVWTEHAIRTELVPSMARLVTGYGCACALGIALGIGIGSSRRIRWATAPLLEFLRALPPPVLAPVLLLVLGVGDTMRVGLIVVGCVWPVLLNTADGVRSMDSVLSDAARTMRLTGLARLRHLVLPAASPRIFAGMYQALGLALVMVVVSEMFAASNGLGVSIRRFQDTFAMAEMWNGVLVLGSLGIVLSLLFRAVEARALHWHRGAGVGGAR
jgi:ABC-type nitrate/sulfonate/bicarbonate transport system permease component